MFEGDLEIGPVKIKGFFEFRLQTNPFEFEVTVVALMELGPIGQVTVEGKLIVDGNGLAARLALTLDANFGADIGISFSGSALLELNTSSQTRTLTQPAGTSTSRRASRSRSPASWSSSASPRPPAWSGSPCRTTTSCSSSRS